MAQNPRQLFLSLVEKEVQQANKLLAILSEEKTALNGKDPKYIEAIVDRKLVLVNSSQQLTKDRDNFLSKLKLPSGREGVEACLEKFAAKDEEIQSTWKALQEIARECQEQNFENEAIAKVNKEFVDKALNVLHGEPIHNQNIYTSKGAKSNSSRIKSLYKI